MDHNPYEAPNSPPSASPEMVFEPRGRVCTACGSRNTGRDMLLNRRPNLIWVMVFGWIVLLIQGAFAMRIERCRDCGAEMRYKSVGSWIALFLVVMIAACMAALLLDG